MKNRITRLFVYGAMAFVLVPGSAFADDGDVGATSTGDTDIILELSDYVQITNILDPVVNFTEAGTPYTPGSAVFAGDPVCVYSNHDTQKYAVTATCVMGTDDGDCDGTFEISVTDETDDDTIPYVVRWAGAAGGCAAAGDGDALTEGALSDEYTGTATYPCADNNACFSVAMTAANIMAVKPGMYVGTLTFVVEPGA